MALYDLGMEICHSADRICLNCSLGVLNHHHTVLVIGIGDSKSRLGQHVEECFLCVTIVLKGLMIVQMVTGKVCEESSLKAQTADTLLGDGVARTFHKGILTASFHHTGKQAVQFNGIRRGM